MREIVDGARGRPFEWGVSDCSLAFDVVLAITGFDALDGNRWYRTEEEAFNVLYQLGFRTVIELVEANFPEIEPFEAQRGDLGYPGKIPHPLMSPAVYVGPLWVSKSPHGDVFVSGSTIKRVFAV